MKKTLLHNRVLSLYWLKTSLKLFKVRPDASGQPRALVIKIGKETNNILNKSESAERFGQKKPSPSQIFINHNRLNPDAIIDNNREILKFLLRRKQMGHFVQQVFLNAVSFALSSINSVYFFFKSWIIVNLSSFFLLSQFILWRGT